MDIKNIYKFYPYNPHDLDSLENNYLWFSRYSEFNDPFEDFYMNNAIYQERNKFNEVSAINFFKTLHRNQFPPHKIEKAILELKLNNKLEEEYYSLIDKTSEHLKKRLDDHIKHSHVCCFSQDGDKPILQNKLMWSHYADGLRGYCIEFDTEKLIEGINYNLSEKVGHCIMSYLPLKQFEFSKLLLSTIDWQSQSTKSEVEHFGSLLTAKSSEWSYEQEIRLIVRDENEIKFNPKAISSITFGEKISKNKLTTLLSTIRGNKEINCPIYRAHMDSSTFELIRSPYE